MPLMTWATHVLQWTVQRVANSLGEFEQAKKYYDRILVRHPGRADTQFDRGLVAMALGEPYQPYLEQAQQLNPDYYKKSEKRIAEIEKTLQELGDKGGH